MMTFTDMDACARVAPSRLPGFPQAFHPMATLPPLRCIGIKQAVLSDDSTAVLLELAMANQQIFPLELDAGGVELLTRVLISSGQALGLDWASTLLAHLPQPTDAA
jgi:hypothetical protein